MIRLMQIIPIEETRLYGLIVNKEVALTKQNQGTFYRSAGKEKDKAKWSHVRYKGWINIQRGQGEVVLVEMRSRSQTDDEWQLFHAFIGWLDRHFSNKIESINIQYRE